VGFGWILLFILLVLLISLISIYYFKNKTKINDYKDNSNSGTGSLSGGMYGGLSPSYLKND